MHNLCNPSDILNSYGEKFYATLRKLKISETDFIEHLPNTFNRGNAKNAEKGFNKIININGIDNYFELLYKHGDDFYENSKTFIIRTANNNGKVEVINDVPQVFKIMDEYSSKYPASDLKNFLNANREEVIYFFNNLNVSDDLLRKNIFASGNNVINLVNTQHIDTSTLRHIFDGDSKGGGFHFLNSPTSRGTVAYADIVFDSNGVGRTRTVSVNGKLKTLKPEEYNTFFPEKWSMQDAVDAINKAYGEAAIDSTKRFPNPNIPAQEIWISDANGISITMYVEKSTGRICSAFPTA